MSENRPTGQGVPQQPNRAVTGSHGVSSYGNLGGTPPRPAAQPSHAPPVPGRGPAHITAPSSRPIEDFDSDPIPMDDDPWVEQDAVSADGTPKPPAHDTEHKAKIVYSHDIHRAQHNYKRPLEPQGRNATRVRSFHSRYSDEGLEFIDKMINEWLDEHPDITIKFVTSTVMTFEGKIREPALVLNVWH